MQTSDLQRMASSGMVRRVALVRTDVSEEIVHSSPILVTLMKDALRSSKRRFLQEPYGETSQKTPLFIVTAVKTSNLTSDLHSSPETVSQVVLLYLKLMSHSVQLVWCLIIDRLKHAIVAAVVYTLAASVSTASHKNDSP
jgi:hypothetical protein